MEKKVERLLEALRASLNQQEVNWSEEINTQEWVDLFQLAEEHHIFPMIYEVVYRCPAIASAHPQLLATAKRRVMQSVMMQTMKTNEFLQLYKHLSLAEIYPFVVKGIICRNLYPKPDYRMSGDEDLLIAEETFAKCHEAMLSFGMQCADPGQDIEKVYEVPYGKPGSLLYIELHKSLFPKDSSAYGEFNSCFKDVFAHAEEIVIEGVPVHTMNYTEHLFYLICHAFKHFLHSGFGIRQVCDIILMANQHGKDVDWNWVLEQAKKIHADLFSAALFQIGEKYLTFDAEKACYPESWRKIQVDELPILDDMMNGGVYGATDRERLHSSTITLNAVSAHKEGKATKVNVIKSIFPSVNSMKGRYPYLEKKPYLLPIAWAERILKYRKEMSASGKNTAAESVKIGGQRVELLKQYKIIE